MPRFIGPFSVPDPDADDWDEMIRRNQQLQAFAMSDYSEDHDVGSDDREFAPLNDPNLPAAEWQELRARQLSQGDHISSGVGSDNLVGGAGNDQIQGGDGADRVAQAAVNVTRWLGAKDHNGRPLHPIGHPGLAESMIPVWGSGREGLANFQEGHPFLGTANLALAAADLFGIGEIAGDVGKLGLRFGKSNTWGAVRKAALKDGLLQSFQPGHHIVQRRLIPKWVPDPIINNWINIKPMTDEVIDGVQHTAAQVHRRLHGRARVNGEWMPEFNFVQKLRYGAKPSTFALGAMPAGIAAAPIEQATIDKPSLEDRN